MNLSHDGASSLLTPPRALFPILKPYWPPFLKLSSATLRTHADLQSFLIHLSHALYHIAKQEQAPGEGCLAWLSNFLFYEASIILIFKARLRLFKKEKLIDENLL